MSAKPNILFVLALTILALTLLLALNSCSPRYYIPNTQNVPVIHSKGQTSLTVAGNGNQGEFQAAYGITNGLAVQANGGVVFPQEDDNGNRGSGSFIEAGPGYFYNISEDWLFDTYALAGFGSMNNNFPTTLQANPSTTGKISANLFRYGVQPGISFHKKYFSITASSRIMGLNYSNIKGDLIFDGTNQQSYLRDNGSNLLIEPALTIRGGLEKIKLQVQLMKSFNVTTPNFRQDNSLISVGLNFNFGGDK